MVGLFSSFRASAESLRAFDQALAVVQNNVTNAGAPGYVRQEMSLVAQRFQVDYGDVGGVRAGSVLSSRNELTEQTVRKQQSEASFSSEQAAQLSQLESLFPVQGDASLSGKLSNFFKSVSQWSVQPNDLTARRTVLDRAAGVAAGFQTTAHNLQVTSANADHDLASSVQEINRLADGIRALNESRRTSMGRETDAGTDAQMHRTLEELAQYANVNVLHQDDGSVSVLFGGQWPLVIGDQVNPISLQTSATSAKVLSTDGADLTATLNGGKLAAQLSLRNDTVLDLQQKLDQLAKAFADQVNTVLAGGLDMTGNAPTQALFQYNAASPAVTLAVNSLVNPADLAGAAAGAAGGNGTIVALSRLDGAAVVNGQTLQGAYGDMVRQVGDQLADARSNKDLRTSLLGQAQQLRDQESGVSLDQEAAKLIQLQRGYQAAAKMMNILDELTQTVMGIIR